MKIVSIVFATYLILHAFRDLLQYFGVKNFFTEVGHEFGVQYTNWILKLFGITYSTEQEIFYFFIELIVGLTILYLIFR